MRRIHSITLTLAVFGCVGVAGSTGIEPTATEHVQVSLLSDREGLDPSQKVVLASGTFEYPAGWKSYSIYSEKSRGVEMAPLCAERCNTTLELSVIPREEFLSRKGRSTLFYLESFAPVSPPPFATVRGNSALHRAGVAQFDVCIQTEAPHSAADCSVTPPLRHHIVAIEYAAATFLCKISEQEHDSLYEEKLTAALLVCRSLEVD